MAKRKNNKKPKKDPEEMIEEEDLDRFAGSSAEEEDDDDDAEEHEASDHSEDEAVAMKLAPEDGYEAPADVEDSSDDESDAEDKTPATANRANDDSSDDDEGGGPKAAGLANAMARILGSAAKGAKGTKPMVLSKTTTRIQKQAEQERERTKEMKEKRQHNRERELQAVHIPLSVATSSEIKNVSKALVKELEMERVHRRVATRGVVALFNAIAQHQNQATKDKESTLLSSSKKADVKKMTKHSFLDMIKSKAVENSALSPNKTKGSDEPQWKALQEGYMLNPKKNWDQESSDEEDDHDEIEKSSPKKKRKKAVA
eukprot:scaffold4562_cov178-Amphora_coffeaeformis.AAC.2